MNVLGKVERFVVEDKEKRARIISSIHDSSHFGINRTIDMVSAKYYWPGLSLDVRQYVSLIILIVCIVVNVLFYRSLHVTSVNTTING